MVLSKNSSSSHIYILICDLFLTSFNMAPHYSFQGSWLTFVRNCFWDNVSPQGSGSPSLWCPSASASGSARVLILPYLPLLWYPGIVSDLIDFCLKNSLCWLTPPRLSLVLAPTLFVQTHFNMSLHVSVIPKQWDLFRKTPKHGVWSCFQTLHVCRVIVRSAQRKSKCSPHAFLHTLLCESLHLYLLKLYGWVAHTFNLST